MNKVYKIYMLKDMRLKDASANARCTLILLRTAEPNTGNITAKRHIVLRNFLKEDTYTSVKYVHLRDTLQETIHLLRKTFEHPRLNRIDARERYSEQR